ncbi:YccF domain-containing protein [Ornithinimicrobium panacihumi]|uniref:YccF domain-containing protein n=1 Tax=Ornithinimicrobium panacihumi TaxID=2008449 RepID=UPI003F8BAEF2
MRLLLNLIWLVFGGIWLALAYLVFGVIACIFIITIPFGIASFRIGAYALWPFGRTIVPTPTAGAMSTLGNIIWFLVAGLWITIAHITTAAAQAVTIIGIPLAVANLKMIPVSLVPLGKQIVDNRELRPGMQPLVVRPDGR